MNVSDAWHLYVSLLRFLRPPPSHNQAKARCALAARRHQAALSAKRGRLRRQPIRSLARERFKKQQSGTFLRTLIYDCMVSEGHFLRKLDSIIGWDVFTKQLTEFYNGGTTYGRPTSVARAGAGIALGPVLRHPEPSLGAGLVVRTRPLANQGVGRPMAQPGPPPRRRRPPVAEYPQLDIRSIPCISMVSRAGDTAGAGRPQQRRRGDALCLDVVRAARL